MNALLRNKRVEMHNLKFKMYTFQIIPWVILEKKLHASNKLKQMPNKLWLLGNLCFIPHHFSSHPQIPSWSLLSDYLLWICDARIVFLFCFKSSVLPHFLVWTAVLTQGHLWNGDSNRQQKDLPEIGRNLFFRSFS